MPELVTGAGGLAGLILAGGRSSRMGGGDKGLLALGDRPVLAHVLARLRPQCGPIVLSANGDPARFAALRLPVVADHPEDREAGPLAGMLAGLDYLAEAWPDRAFVLTCPADTPFLPADLAERLAAACISQGAEAAIARSLGRDHPLTGLFPVGMRDGLRALLRGGERRVYAVLDTLKVARVEWPDEPDPFFNINTPSDLEQARARLASQASS